MKIEGTLFACALVIVVLTGSAAQAQQGGSWTPKRNVEIVVGVSGGGAADRTARTVQRILQDQKIVSQPLTVLNRPGGGGNLAWTYTASQAGEGRVIAIATQQLLTNHMSGRTKLSHNDLTPVALLFGEFHPFAVRTASTLTSPKVMLDRLRQDPGSVSFGVASAGGAHHMVIGLLMKHIGVDVKKVRVVVFNSGSETVTAMLGGHVDVALSNPGSIEPMVKSGQARALAIAAPQRLEGVYASVPTWRESGVDAVFMAWRGVVGPPQLPAEQVAFWEQALLAMTRTDDWKAELQKFYWTDIFRGSAAMKKYLDEEYTQTRAIMQDLGLI